MKTLGACIISGALLAGCVADGPTPSGSGPGPRPTDAVPTHLVVNMKDFTDTDRNGYLDSATATVYLFADGYALPLGTTGSFEFTLTDTSGTRIADWHITPEQADPCRIKTQVGPGYAFNLDLRQVGAEKTEQHDAVLVGEFTDARDRSVRSGRLSVTIGHVR